MKTLKLAIVSVKKALELAGLPVASYGGYYWSRGFEVRANKTGKDINYITAEWHSHHRYVTSDAAVEADNKEAVRMYALAVEKLTAVRTATSGYKAEYVEMEHNFHTDKYVKVTLI